MFKQFTVDQFLTRTSSSMHVHQGLIIEHKDATVAQKSLSYRLPEASRMHSVEITACLSCSYALPSSLLSETGFSTWGTLAWPRDILCLISLHEWGGILNPSLLHFCAYCSLCFFKEKTHLIKKSYITLFLLLKSYITVFLQNLSNCKFIIQSLVAKNVVLCFYWLCLCNYFKNRQ